eukprot:TRINITY_DN721_c0_g1_i1.p1 TRINITY_DN721_c0_g1~~TRINITY_DN721_c0_g1_i1.p1  ORF type:complete len:307 (+),score=39.00 TRINITY_DN721_c0_g1_i1:50-970(+)
MQPSAQAATTQQEHPKLMLPLAAIRSTVQAAPQASQSPVMSTPMDAPSTYWRTVTSPNAPLRQEARRFSDLAAPSPMSIAAASPTDMVTPANVATSAWRRQVCPLAPQRKEVAPTAWPASPINMWPEYSPLNARCDFSPASGILAPSPQHYLGQLPVLQANAAGQPMLSPTASSLGGSPLNTAFLASPTNALGGMSVTSVMSSAIPEASPFFVDATPSSRRGSVEASPFFVDATPSSRRGSVEASPFHVDATPISRKASVGPQDAFFENFGVKPRERAKSVPEVVFKDMRRPLGVSNTVNIARLGA